MQQCLHFASLPNEIEKEFGVVVLSKVILLDIVLEEV
jgi:hypothetical protein